MRIWLHNNILWYIKQLLPLKYHTHYGENGKDYVSVWRMWFGRCFKIEKWEVVNKTRDGAKARKNIQNAPQTPSELAASTALYFSRTRWTSV